MCGIIGIASTHPVKNRDWLGEGAELMRHRGPDGNGEWWSRDFRVGFAHRRLAIIDLSDAGKQPMHDSTGQVSITYNGEIYNYKILKKKLTSFGHSFRTNCDTEVIIAAYKQWGADCLKHLEGMFAFGIFDKEKNTILLARDRAGEKPLFYYHKNGELRFASELKGLLADKTAPRKISREAMDFYLFAGFTPGSACILDGYNKLPAAHCILFDLSNGDLKAWRYWHLPHFKGDAPRNTPDTVELVNELRDLLFRSVQNQLVADVPVGVLLSGGVDSSIVTAIAAQSSERIKTFTVSFPGYDKYDEAPHARLIADYFDTEHIELSASQPDASILLSLAKQFDEPMIDSSMLPTFLVSKLVQTHCSVVLGGDGGDELFGGYGHHSRLLWLKSHTANIPNCLKNLLAWGAMSILPIGLKGRNWLYALSANLDKGLPLIASYFDSASRKKLLRDQADWQFVSEDLFRKMCPVDECLLQRMTRMDFGNYLSEDILVKVDRASMLNSLEVRAPLLDKNLIEFAFGRVPSYLKADEKNKKILLKELAFQILPKEFDFTRKQGFSIPLDSWLKGGDFRDLFNDVLRSSNTIFDKKFTEELLLGLDRGRSNSERLFGLVMFELWRKEYRTTL